MSVEATCWLVYGVGFFVGACAAYELRVWIGFHFGDDESGWLPVIVGITFWPPTLGLAAVAVLLWLASWTVRGPIRLTRWWLERRSVDRASVRCADSKALPKAWVQR